MSIDIERIAESIVEDAYAEARDAYPGDDESDNRYDYALERIHEYTENSESVIYYSEAWEVVYSDNGGVCESAAEAMGTDLAEVMRQHGLNNMICTLAYCGIYDTACGMLSDIIREEDITNV